MLALEGEIVAQFRMDHRRAGIERGLGIGDGGKLLVGHLDQFARVLGLRPRLRHHGAHRLALPARAIDRDRVLRRRLDALEMGQHADPRGDDLCELRTGDDSDHAGYLLRGRGVDRNDPRMRMRRTEISDVPHARQRDIADILPAAFGQAREVRPRHRAADIGVWPVERGQDGR